MLLLAKERTAAAVALVWHYLDAVEWYVAKAEFLSPRLHHECQTVGVCPVAAGVRLTLIPDYAFVCIGCHGVEHGVVHEQGARPLLLLFHILALETYVREFLEQAALHPVLHSRAAVGAHHHAHRHVERTAQRRGEVVGRGTELGGVTRFRPHPPSAARVGRLPALCLGYGEEAHVAVLACPEYCLCAVLHGAVVESPQRHLHVALSRREPHLAHEHVVNGQRLAVVECQRVRLVIGLRGAYGYGPASVVTRFALQCASVPRRFYLYRRTFARCRSAQAHVAVLLYHHARRYERCGFYFRIGSAVRHDGYGQRGHQ